MKTLLMFARFLPLIMSTVVAVEHNIRVPGQTKAQIALGIVQAAAQSAGEVAPEAQTISSAIDSVVGVLNATGVFTRGAASAAPAGEFPPVIYLLTPKR